MEPTLAERKRLLAGFPITNVCRADLDEVGFDTRKISDHVMAELASKMANAYCEMGFWEDLDILAEHLKIPKRKQRTTTKL